VDIFRKARARGFSGLQIWMLASGCIGYGFYRVGVHNRENNAERALAREARYAIAPILQAEEDLWYHEREQYIMQKEADVMKNVPNWQAGESPYLTSRWVPRQSNMLDRNIKK
jgi:NADH dehydrogenase (ubiquinone) 1 alpha subcomplex subunit 13